MINYFEFRRRRFNKNRAAPGVLY